MTDETLQPANSEGGPRRASHFIALGVLVVGMAALGFVLLTAGGGHAEQGGLIAALRATETATPTATLTPTATYRPYSADGSTPPAESSAAVERQVVSPPTRTPTPTLTPTPQDTATPTITPTFDAPEIHWSQADRNALSWLCYGEVGGMGWSKVDACLSVISTVRVRSAYGGNNYTGSLIENLMRPGQFNVRIETDQPSPDADLNYAVELYEQGARGSCTGYLYFNSSPSGPGACVIYGAANQFIQFHNSW